MAVQEQQLRERESSTTVDNPKTERFGKLLVKGLSVDDATLKNSVDRALRTGLSDRLENYASATSEEAARAKESLAQALGLPGGAAAIRLYYSKETGSAIDDSGSIRGTLQLRHIGGQPLTVKFNYNADSGTLTLERTEGNSIVLDSVSSRRELQGYLRALTGTQQSEIPSPNPLPPVQRPELPPVRPSPPSQYQGSLIRNSLSPEGEQWMKLQRQLTENTLAGAGHPRLVDASRFLSSTMESALSREASGRMDSRTGLALTQINEGGYRFAIRTSQGDTWYVSEAPWYRDQYPEGIQFKNTEVVIWKKGSDGLVQANIRAGDLFEGGRFNFNKAAEQIRFAEQNYRSESADQARSRNYDMSSNQVGYIGLVDGNKSDPIIRGIVEDAKYFPEMMNSLRDANGNRRYNLVTYRGSEQLVVESNPGATLERYVDALHARGVREFRLNLVGHGDSEGIHFTHNGRDLVLTASDLRRVFDKYQDSKFLVDTVACYGGNVAGMIAGYHDPSGDNGRVVVRLQSKPLAINQEGRIAGPGVPRVHSSYYNVLYAGFVQQGLRDGEAHYRADRETKRRVSCDAEVWVSSPIGGISTKAVGGLTTREPN